MFSKHDWISQGTFQAAVLDQLLPCTAEMRIEEEEECGDNQGSQGQGSVGERWKGMLLPRALGVALLSGCSLNTGEKGYLKPNPWVHRNIQLDSMAQKTPVCPTSQSTRGLGAQVALSSWRLLSEQRGLVSLGVDAKGAAYSLTRWQCTLILLGKQLSGPGNRGASTTPHLN